MRSRERITKIMDFEVPNRVGMFDWYWSSALERWKAEGYPEDAGSPADRYGFDIRQIGCDQSFGFEHKVLEEDDQTQVVFNSYGMTERHWKGSKQGAPEQIDRLIKTRADWEAHKDRFLDVTGRIPDTLAQSTRDQHEKGLYLTYWYLEPFELAWRFLGFKETLMMMAADPELISEIFEACADQIIACYEAAAAAGAEYDANWAGGDIACKTGTLFSPKMYRELLMPHHKRIFSYFNERGLPTMYHGDGDCRPVLDDLIEAGVIALHPLEVKAGMDLVWLKEHYDGRLVLFGGIDVRALSGTKADIDREVHTKVPVAMKGGGYIYCVDHSVAPTVSLDNYEYALALIREVGRY